MQTYLNYTGLRENHLKIQVFLFFALSVFAQNYCLWAQDTLRARKNLEVLSSKEMMGRGYLFQGHTKAANFIQAEFEKAGLK